MNNEINKKCTFVTKQNWFFRLYLYNNTIYSNVIYKNLEDYKKIIKRLKYLQNKQEQSPTNSRIELINLKEIQKIIFLNQFKGYYNIIKTSKLIESTPDIFLTRPLKIRNEIERKKINLLTAIYRMERNLCQLEFIQDITIQRNQLKNNLRSRLTNANFASNLPKANEPELRRLFTNWLRAVNLRTINNNIINGNYTNELAKSLNNPEKKREFSKIMKNMEEDNFELSLRFKKSHLKTEKCKFAIQERTPSEKSKFLHQLEDKPIIPWETILNMIGIDSLSFLNGQTEHKRAIIELLNLYLMPITEQFDDIFRLKREYYLMCISFVLFDFNIKNVNYLPEEEGTPGFTATTRINENSIYKLENFRFENYPVRSYMSSVYLFSFFIQKYLYNLNHNYVPNVENIFYHFTQKEIKKSITKMNLARRNNNRYQYSINLQQFLIKPIEKNGNTYFFEIVNFEQFMIKILKKICEILIFYQDSCFFVHRDFHTGNILINFNINHNDNNFDLENFKVKIIDFTYSSMIIKNKNGIESEFMNSSYNNLYDIKLSNPYLNKEWNCYDLKYFFLSLLFARLYEGKQEKLEENYYINKIFNSLGKEQKLKNVISIILFLLDIDKNYLARYILFKSNYYKNNKNYKKKCINRISQVFRELLYNNKLLNEIMGNKCKTINFNPRFILSKINEFY